MGNMLALNVERVLTTCQEDLDIEEKDAILELAYLAIAADGKLMEAELEAFTDAMLLIYGDAVTAEQVSQLVTKLVKNFENDHDEDMETFTAKLTRPCAKNQAYKLAYAMAMSDLDTNDSEFEFDQKLRRLLSLSDEEAEALTDQVVDAIGVRD